MSVRKLNKVGPTHLFWRGRATKKMPGLPRGTSKSIFMLQNKAWGSPVCFGILATPFYIAIWTKKLATCSKLFCQNGIIVRSMRRSTIQVRRRFFAATWKILGEGDRGLIFLKVSDK